MNRRIEQERAEGAENCIIYFERRKMRPASGRMPLANSFTLDRVKYDFVTPLRPPVSDAIFVFIVLLFIAPPRTDPISGNTRRPLD